LGSAAEDGGIGFKDARVQGFKCGWVWLRSAAFLSSDSIIDNRSS
jgi:hypothetical protein